jgi:hypothetical protein
MSHVTHLRPRVRERTARSYFSRFAEAFSACPTPAIICLVSCACACATAALAITSFMVGGRSLNSGNGNGSHVSASA